MTDLSNSVIMPREDFVELSTVAFDNSHVPSFGERTAQVTQTTFILTALAGACVATVWGWSKANDWLEDRRHKRELTELQFKIDNNLVK